MTDKGSYRELMVAAKQQQRQQLKELSALSSQLARFLSSVVAANSTNSENCSPLMDKITTIHQIDAEIDRQLNETVGGNFEKLQLAMGNVESALQRANKAGLAGDFVWELQRNVELLDQDLRILERTLELIEMGRSQDEGFA